MSADPLMPKERELVESLRHVTRDTLSIQGLLSIIDRLAPPTDQAATRQWRGFPVVEVGRDGIALDEISRELSGRDWTAEDLETVASIVRATGRPVLDAFQIEVGTTPSTAPEKERK